MVGGNKDKLHPDPCFCSHLPRGRRPPGAPDLPSTRHQVPKYFQLRLGPNSPTTAGSQVCCRERLDGALQGGGRVEGPASGASLPSLLASSPVLCQAQGVLHRCELDGWTNPSLCRPQVPRTAPCSGHSRCPEASQIVTGHETVTLLPGVLGV